MSCLSGEIQKKILILACRKDFGPVHLAMVSRADSRRVGDTNQLLPGRMLTFESSISDTAERYRSLKGILAVLIHQSAQRLANSVPLPRYPRIMGSILRTRDPEQDADIRNLLLRLKQWSDLALAVFQGHLCGPDANLECVRSCRDIRESWS